MGSFSGAPKPLGTAVDTENGTLNSVIRDNTIIKTAVKQPGL